MQGKVEICGVNTSKLKVLKNEETMELLRRTKAGDQKAREELISETCGWCCPSSRNSPAGGKT